MTTTQQPDAILLAGWLDETGGSLSMEFATELRRLHARVVEPEAQLEAIGAGGVETLRKSGKPS